MARRIVVLALLIFALLSSARAYAATITIDFDSLNEPDSVTNQFPGLTFSNTVILMAGSLLVEQEAPPHSGQHIATNDGGPIEVVFGNPVSSVGGYFTYLTPLLLEVFDAGNNSLGSISSLFSNNLLLSGDAGSSPNEFLGLAFSNISRVTITGDPAVGSLILDDFTYTTSDVPVPEPGTLSLVLLGSAGLLRWRKHRNRHVDN